MFSKIINIDIQQIGFNVLLKQFLILIGSERGKANFMEPLKNNLFEILLQRKTVETLDPLQFSYSKIDFRLNKVNCILDLIKLICTRKNFSLAAFQFNQWVMNEGYLSSQIMYFWMLIDDIWQLLIADHPLFLTVIGCMIGF